MKHFESWPGQDGDPERSHRVVSVLEKSGLASWRRLPPIEVCSAVLVEAGLGRGSDIPESMLVSGPSHLWCNVAEITAKPGPECPHLPVEASLSLASSSITMEIIRLTF